MASYFISRHSGAIDWIKLKNIPIDFFLSHLPKDLVFSKGDILYGTLPITLIYKVNCQGDRYINLDLSISENFRGKELSHQQLESFEATLTE